MLPQVAPARIGAQERLGNKWSEIAKHVPGRVGKQCRERWFNNLDPSILKGNWTEAEDATLIEAHKQLGNKWS